MATTRYVAFIRGINVGGKNILSMAELRAVFEAAGYDNVSTYIQSGNVLFESDKARSCPRLARPAHLEDPLLPCVLDENPPELVNGPAGVA